MSLRVKRGEGSEGIYELFDDDAGPIVEANRFLAAQDIRGLSQRTTRAYAFDLLVLYRWLQRVQRRLSKLRQSDLIDFVADERRRSAHPHSINRRLTTCRLLYRFATGKELEANPGSVSNAPHYKGRGRDRDLGLHRLGPSRPRLRVKTSHQLVEPLTPRQVRTFLRSLRRYRDLAIVYLMLLGGLRSREVLGIQLRDIDLGERMIRVRGKGEKERQLPMPDVLATILDDYLRFERPERCSRAELFVILQGARRGRPMSAPGLRSLFRQRRIKPEIANANPHRFRHTFGADMARAGVRLPILQKMMGHASGATTLQYINLSMSDVAAEYRRASEEIRKRYGA
jgi:site-specific recombinase XerD